jgi:hypothetical protein
MRIRLACLVLVPIAACETETPTSAVVDNGYDPIPDGGDASKELTVYKAWWSTTLFTAAVAPRAESEPERTVPASDTAYAILAVGWDPSSSTPPDPTTLVPVQSSGKLSVARGEALHIRVSDDSFDGRCNAGRALSQDEADLITRRIFPGEFVDVVYDAKTCTARARPSNGGLKDASLDASSD